MRGDSPHPLPLPKGEGLQKKIVVIGGGITGLSAAYRLKHLAVATRGGLDIQLLEASPHLGGTLRTTSHEGFLMEGGPDCFLAEKTRAVQLCQELGLKDQLINTHTENRRSFIVRNGTLHPVPQGFYLIGPSKLRPFLASPLVSWSAKWRVLLEPLLPSHPKTDESLASFVRRRLGQDVLDWYAQPLLAGIYAADPETLSLQATFPQFLRMEEKGGSVLVGLKKRDTATQEASGARYCLFVTLRKGMQTLVDQLENHLTGVTIRKETSVEKLKRGPGGWEITRAQGEIIKADAVCLALPAYRCAELLENENPAVADLLRSIPYTGSATLNVAFRENDIPHPLDGFGFVTPFAEKRTTLACTFVHRKFPDRVPAGHALLRAFVGGALQADLLGLDEAELKARVLKDFRDLLGITAAPLFSTLDRWPRAMPQYTLGHVHRLLQIEEMISGMRGLTLAGNWMRGVGIPDCIESGEEAAAALV